MATLTEAERASIAFAVVVIESYAAGRRTSQAARELRAILDRPPGTITGTPTNQQESKTREILRGIVVDYAVELCDDLPDCDCSLAQAWRLVRDEKQDEPVH